MNWSLKYLTVTCTVLVFTYTSSLISEAIASTSKQAISYENSRLKSSQPHPAFQSILPKLKQKTKLKILLPKFLSGDDGVNPIYAIIETATRDRYSIILGYTPNCNGGTACRLGTVYAESVTAKTPRLTGKKVSLANKITGYFVDATCGANCSDATLTWRQSNVQYTVGLKAGDRTSLVKMANSTIVP
jgi:hypothetical protein